MVTDGALAAAGGSLVPVPMAVVPAEELPARPLYFVIKRLADVVFSLVAIVLLAPILLAVAVAVGVTTPGPVLYRQERVGARQRSGRRLGGGETWELLSFHVYKFRTMYVDADPNVHIKHTQMFTSGVLQSQGGSFKLMNDDRITPVGRLLRRLSIDELPQLLNVLRGQMSLVGPRPVPVYEVAGYSASDFQRFTAVPGITGLWQIRGRCTLGFDEMVSLDVAYARRRSLLLDVRIVLATLPAVIRAKGAG